MIDRDVRSASSEYVQKTGPVTPSGTTARIVGLVCNVANFIEGLDLLGVPPEGEHDLGLFQDCIDATPPVRLRIGHPIKPVERGGKIR